MRARAPGSALAVLASSSGVSSERAAFMELVREEINRLNRELGKRGSVSMVFQKGSVLVRRRPRSAQWLPFFGSKARLNQAYWCARRRWSARQSWRRWWGRSGWRTA